ncbi:MAG: prepilin-type N-terminal cleavage/methylation domain-containing protein [Cetobacterium sp.]|uniref:prepilin-type N-terminal cleavage/methylation domain-containing protein n=1 Tax=unclassified Cetobacterium TaxID=2630983 RepID=UPI00163D1857|nr:prepilin-type N-terminal cleavage/methylation domain-containing protein [Cetobacterium sp. 2A]MBC2856316.1 prepilin-type N-terminal cleavage/methylation domain-containing protein [Cetobacterium sp. 2A]
MLRNKNKGISFLEVVVTIGILSLVSLILGSTMKIFFILNKDLERDYGYERTGKKNLQQISRDLKIAISLSEIYDIRILKEDSLTSSLLNNPKTSGNTLVLKIPEFKNGQLHNSYKLYRFNSRKLEAYYAKESTYGVIRIDLKTKDSILENIDDGIFLKVGTFIKFEFKFLGGKKVEEWKN